MTKKHKIVATTNMHKSKNAKTKLALIGVIVDYTALKL